MTDISGKEASHINANDDPPLDLVGENALMLPARDVTGMSLAESTAG